MDKDFERKVKGQKKKSIAVTVIVIAIILLIIGTIRFGLPGGGSIGPFGNKYAYVEINCTQLTKDMSKLKKPELKDYVPKDGKILPKTKVKLEKDDTAFSVTDRICREKNIQMESKYTPGYKSYYVEGINYLYEFSAGKYSGWMYYVNDERPNYAADKIKLKNGDVVRWDYTVDYKKDGM